MILVGLTFALLAVTLPADSLVVSWRNFAVSTLSLYGETAIDIFEKKGHHALSEHLNQLESTSDIKVYLFDKEGSSLGETKPPPVVREVALRTADGKGVALQRFRKVRLVAKRLVGQDGGLYVIVAEIPAVPFTGFSSVSGTRLIRVMAVTVIAGIVCFWLAKYLTSPIGKLQAATRRFANGDLKVRVGSHVGGRRDEIAQLAHDFDVMAARIEALISAQSRLTRDISHELRSPLARLSVALELARKEAGKGAVEALNRIECETDRLNGMIGQLLTLTRLESGTDVVEKAQVDLTGLIGEIINDAEFEAQSRDCSVRFSSDEEITIPGVKDLLKRAIENVVRNGLHYTAAGTEVEVSVIPPPQDGGQFVLVLVRDHGRGVDEDVLPNLFQPFFRVGEARDRSTGGTGLGLAIAERAVRLHGGTISAANASGGGLVVEIRLPVS